MAQRIHANEILTEILRLIEDNLKTPLSLQGAYRGSLNWLPPTSVVSLVNGIWVDLVGQTTFEEVAMPKGVLATYQVRMVFVRRLDISNNINEQRITDGNKMVEMIYDNFKLANIAEGGGLPLSNGQPLWFLPRSIEWRPPEDDFVQSISGDLTAIVGNAEVLIRTKF